MTPLGSIRSLFARFGAPVSADAPQTIPTLDGARGVAVGMVLVSHSANAGFLPGMLGHGLGQRGVALFFALSGFLMAYLYADRKFTFAEVRRYAAHRIGRVVPLYYLFVLASWALWNSSVPVWLFHIDSATMLRDHLFFIRGEATLWTIPVEVQYYAIFVFLWAMHARGLTVSALSILATAALVANVVLHAYDGPRESLSNWALLFIVGSALGLIWRRYHRQIGGWAGERKPLAWIVLGTMVLSLPEVMRALDAPAGSIPVKLLSNGMPIALFVAMLCGTGPFRILASESLRWLGKVSYGIYLWHYPVLATYLSLVPEQSRIGHALGFPVIAAATIVLAWLSFVAFESPARVRLSRVLAGPAHARLEAKKPRLG